MITRETKRIEEKINKVFKKLESETNYLGIRINGDSSSAIGMDTEDYDGLFALIIVKTSEGVMINGHILSKVLSYSNIKGFTADAAAKKYIAINARNRDNIKLFYYDLAGIGVEISDDTTMNDDEMVICFIETNNEAIYLLACPNRVKSGKEVKITSTSNEPAKNFLRQNALEFLNLVSSDMIKEISEYFKEDDD